MRPRRASDPPPVRHITPTVLVTAGEPPPRRAPRSQTPAVTVPTSIPSYRAPTEPLRQRSPLTQRCTLTGLWHDHQGRIPLLVWRERPGIEASHDVIKCALCLLFRRRSGHIIIVRARQDLSFTRCPRKQDNPVVSRSAWTRRLFEVGMQTTDNFRLGIIHLGHPIAEPSIARESSAASGSATKESVAACPNSKNPTRGPDNSSGNLEQHQCWPIWGSHSCELNSCIEARKPLIAWDQVDLPPGFQTCFHIT